MAEAKALQNAPTVDVAISNRNSAGLLKACLWSVAVHPPRLATISRVVVVDNASTDGSADGLETIPVPLTLIRNREDRGYGANCNTAVRGSRADYVLFLNSDARLYEGTIDSLVKCLQAPDCRSVGLVGPQLIDDLGGVDRSCARFPTLSNFLAKSVGLEGLFPRRFPPIHMTDWDHSETREVDHVMGAVVLMRREVFEILGGFDERFHVYMEDVDLSLRARRAGFGTVYLASSQAYHKGGGSIRQVEANSLYHVMRSRMLYASKNFGPLGGGLVMGATLLIEPMVRIAWSAARLSTEDLVATLVASARVWRSVPQILAAQAALDRSWRGWWRAINR